MSSPGPVHPLDVDLADLVDGTVDDERTAPLEAHLAGCLLCRIKCQRLRAAPPVPLRTDAPGPVPAFVVPHLDEGREPAPGELWLGGDDPRLLVLVRYVDGDRVGAVPVTFDVEAADDETAIVDIAQSPLGLALAVYPRLSTELPRCALVGRVGRFIGDLDLDGAPHGRAITGASDPRLDVRQYLADALGSIEEAGPDPQTAADAPPLAAEHARSALIRDLRDLRGAPCIVQPLVRWPGALPAQRLGWAPVATIDEVGIVLVVLDTPHGLTDDQDFDAARAVLTRLNATALVVLAQPISHVAEVFDSSSLNYGIDTPAGVRSPPWPLISGLAPFDAIAKFLDQHTGVRMTVAPSRGAVGHVDVGEVLRESTAAAVADAARQGSRFKIAPKRRGYESLAGAAESLDAALGRSFAGEPVVEALFDLARRPDDEQ